MHCGFRREKNKTQNKHILFWPSIYVIKNNQILSEKEHHTEAQQQAILCHWHFLSPLLFQIRDKYVFFSVNRWFCLHKFDSTSFNAKSYRNSYSHTLHFFSVTLSRSPLTVITECSTIYKCVCFQLIQISLEFIVLLNCCLLCVSPPIRINWFVHKNKAWISCIQIHVKFFRVQIMAATHFTAPYASNVSKPKRISSGTIIVENTPNKFNLWKET